MKVGILTWSVDVAAPAEDRHPPAGAPNNRDRDATERDDQHTPEGTPIMDSRLVESQQALAGTPYSSHLEDGVTHQTG
jgi:hypothetical protein